MPQATLRIVTPAEGLDVESILLNGVSRLWEGDNPPSYITEARCVSFVVIPSTLMIRSLTCGHTTGETLR